MSFIFKVLIISRSYTMFLKFSTQKFENLVNKRFLIVKSMNAAKNKKILNYIYNIMHA